MRRFAALLPLFLLITACGPSAEDVTGEYRARADKKLTQVRAAVKKAADFNADFKVPAIKDKLSFQGDGANTALAHIEDFSEPAGKADLDLIFQKLWYSVPVDTLKDAAGRDADSVRSSFESLLALKYLLLVKTKYYSGPAVSADSSFLPGSWEAHVLLVDIEKGEVLGGWNVTAKNSDKVSVNTKEPDKWLHSDIWSNARRAIAEAVKPLCADGQSATS
jgi:hypothetical protein